MKKLANGSHFKEKDNSFEWWYFHFVCPQLSLNLVLHETDIFGLNKNPYMSLSLLRKGHEPRYYKEQLDTETIIKNTMYLRTKNNIFTEDEKGINFNLNFDGCKFKGKIDKNSSQISINSGILYENPDERKSMWLVELPFGLFDATLELGEDNLDLKGVAYHDHQWGSLRIQDFVSQWIWGHLSNRKINIVFFHIFTQNGEIINRAIIGSFGNTEKSTVIETKCLSDFAQKSSFYEKRYRANFMFPNNNLNLEVDISPKNLMRSRILEKHQAFNATYLRWAAEAVARQGEIGRNLTGLVEYLAIDNE